MFYIKEEYNSTLEVKQSKFIAHLLPFDIYQKRLDELKLQHPKARHFVTAYRYKNEYNQIVEASSDDGEPKGTSGKPSLMVLSGHNLINTAVIVVRYFGGTKLGTGGLVRAYSDAVNQVINNAKLLEYKDEKTIEISFNYNDIRIIDYELEKLDINIIDKNFSSNVIYKLKAPQEILDNFLSSLNCITHIPHR